MTYCRTQIQKHSLIQIVNFLENNEATRLKAEHSQKVAEWDSSPVGDPKGLSKKISSDPSSQTHQQVSLVLPQWIKIKGKVLFPRRRCLRTS